VSRVHIAFDDRGEVTEYELQAVGAGETIRLQWAAMMLALEVDSFASILRGLRVRAGNLDGFVLRRALRGGELPNVEDYIEVTADMLDAIREAGRLKDGPPPPLPKKQKGGR
jgi:hypothetical protein